MQKTIFILEDNIDLQELFTLLLEMEGYTTKTFGTIASFNKAILGLVPDLFLLDVMLPDGDGGIICSELKKNTITSHIPIIMTSANANLQQIKLDCQADDYVAKPFNIQELIDKVAHNIN